MFNRNVFEANIRKEIFLTEGEQRRAVREYVDLMELSQLCSYIANLTRGLYERKIPLEEAQANMINYLRKINQTLGEIQALDKELYAAAKKIEAILNKIRASNVAGGTGPLKQAISKADRWAIIMVKHIWRAMAIQVKYVRILNTEIRSLSANADQNKYKIIIETAEKLEKNVRTIALYVKNFRNLEISVEKEEKEWVKRRHFNPSLGW